MNPSILGTLRERAQRVVERNDDRPSVGTLLAKMESALTLAQSIESGAAAIRDNTLWPAEHRTKKLREGTTANVKAIQSLENEIAELMRGLGNERRFRERLPAAPADPVSVQLRAEMRSILRGMPMRERLQAVRLENISSDMLAAVMEAAPELSGLPAPLVQNLRRSLIAAKGTTSPDVFDSNDAELQALSDAALSVARGAASEASAMPQHDFAARVNGVRIEMTAAVDRSDADLPTLLGAARSAA